MYIYYFLDTGAVEVDELIARGRSESAIMRIEIDIPSTTSIKTMQQNLEFSNTSLQLFLSLEVEVRQPTSRGSRSSTRSSINFDHFDQFDHFDLALCIETSDKRLRPFKVSEVGKEDDILSGLYYL